MKLKKKFSKEHLDKEAQKSLDYYQSFVVPEYSGENTPFFILGSPRSGTTLLRDLLREHPRLECPEETHFFRWADPFGSPKFTTHYKTKLFREHRALDNISEFNFSLMLNATHSRKHLSYEYGRTYLEMKGKPDARLYDKTPQNVYGIFLINAIYPEAKFIHIYRNPLNVVASLKEGKVMPVHSLRGAINSWTESMLLLDQFKKFKPELLLELPYEELTANPDPYLKQILEFVGEDPKLLPSQKNKTHKEKNKYKEKLLDQEIQIVLDKCEPFLSQYGYGNKNKRAEGITGKTAGFLKNLLS
jgi:hypothetical protein